MDPLGIVMYMELRIRSPRIGFAKSLQYPEDSYIPKDPDPSRSKRIEGSNPILIIGI